MHSATTLATIYRVAEPDGGVVFRPHLAPVTKAVQATMLSNCVTVVARELVVMTLRHAIAMVTAQVVTAPDFEVWPWRDYLNHITGPPPVEDDSWRSAFPGYGRDGAPHVVARQLAGYLATWCHANPCFQGINLCELENHRLECEVLLLEAGPAANMVVRLVPGVRHPEEPLAELGRRAADAWLTLAAARGVLGQLVGLPEGQLPDVAGDGMLTALVQVGELELVLGMMVPTIDPPLVYARVPTPIERASFTRPNHGPGAG